MNKTNSRVKLQDLTILVMFVAVEIVMKLLGLGSVPVGPLNMSFLTVPVALGAMLLGSWQGAVLGCVFGLCSFYDAVSGGSVMTGIFLQINPFSTFLLCVLTRTLMGLCTGLLFGLLRKVDRTRTVCYYVGALVAPLLNTLFFMGYIVLFFYGTEYIQGLVTKFGAVNPIAFVIALVGVQGLVEAGVCCVVGGSVGKGVAHALKLDKNK